MSIEAIAEEQVSGRLHWPERTVKTGIVLSHGAGSNSESKLLVAVASEFARAGIAALRIDLAFRRGKAGGAPHPSGAAKDRESIRQASLYLASRGVTRVFLGGHSYGGRQSTMLAAEEPEVASSLLLMSYPLHPPKKPEQLRTAHFPSLATRCLFVHGTRDPFGTPEEMRASLPASGELLLVEKAGHELKPVLLKPGIVVESFLRFASGG